MTTKITSLCDGATNFSSFLPLALLSSCSDVSDCHSPFFSCAWHFVLITVQLKANHPVSSHSRDVVSVPCDGKGISLRLSLLSSYHPDLLVRHDPREEEESLQFLWVLVWCLLYPVTYGLHRKNINNHSVFFIAMTWKCQTSFTVTRSSLRRCQAKEIEKHLRSTWDVKVQTFRPGDDDGKQVRISNKMPTSEPIEIG